MNYSYLHTSKALLAAPAHKFFAGVMYAPGRFTFNVNVQSIFDLYINTADKVKEDYTVLNAKAAYRFGTRDKGLNLFVKGENLTATRYSINEGFPDAEGDIYGRYRRNFLAWVEKELPRILPKIHKTPWRLPQIPKSTAAAQ